MSFPASWLFCIFLNSRCLCFLEPLLWLPYFPNCSSFLTFLFLLPCKLYLHTCCSSAFKIGSVLFSCTVWEPAERYLRIGEMDVLLSAPGSCVTEFSYQLGHTEVLLQPCISWQQCAQRRWNHGKLRWPGVNSGLWKAYHWTTIEAIFQRQKTACHIVDTA